MDDVHEQSSGEAEAPREIEWQLECADCAGVERWLLSSATNDLAESGLRFEARPPVLNRDTYLDTAVGSVSGAGSSIRIRTVGGARELTTKTGGSSAPGLRDRTELTLELAPGIGPQMLEGVVGERVRELTSGEALVEDVALATLRRRFDVVRAGERCAEIALDEVCLIENGASSEPFQRVEVESKAETTDGAQAVADALRARFALEAAPDSKLERARAMQTAALARLLPAASTAIDGSMSTGEAARLVAGRNLAALLLHGPGVRLGEVEAVHQARVAVRRTRAALSLFGHVLPDDARTISGELAFVGRALGDVRDLDVQLIEIARMQTEHGDDLSDVLAVLAGRRSSAARKARAMFDSPRARTAIGHAATLVGSPVATDGPAATGVSRAAAGLITKRYRPVARDARAVNRKTPASELHALRLRCKRLRYSVEFFMPLYPNAAGAVVRQLGLLQDRLGAQQDAVVAGASLRKLAHEVESQQLAFQLGRVAERYAVDADAGRHEIKRELRRLRRRSWRRLERELRGR